MSRAATLVAVAAAALAAAAVITALATRSPTRERSPAREPAQRAVVADRFDVRVARSRLGRILVDRRGHTLYLFREDRHGKSTCYDGCARVWPPALVAGAPHPGAGVTATKLTTTRRRDHRRQLVYNHHPLYDMSGDARPGDAVGQGFMGTWFVVSPAGRQIGRAHGSGGY